MNLSFGSGSLSCNFTMVRVMSYSSCGRQISMIEGKFTPLKSL